MAFLTFRLYRRLCQNEKEDIFLPKYLFPGEAFKIRSKAFHSEETRAPTEHCVHYKNQTGGGKPAELPIALLKEGGSAVCRLHTWGSHLLRVESLTKGREKEAIFLRKLVTALQPRGTYKEQGIKVTSCSFF